MNFLLIKSFKVGKKSIVIGIVILVVSIVLLSSIAVFYSFAMEEKEADKKEDKRDFIKWVDFNVTAEALNLTAKLDIDSHQNNGSSEDGIVYNWIELLAYLACKNGGNFKNFKKTDLDTLVSELKNGQTIEDLTR